MIKAIREKTRSDPEVLRLLEAASEYAEVYLLVRKRRKGCDGMGELAMIKEEFREAVYDLINYCKGKEYLTGDFQYDLDTVADTLIPNSEQEG